MKSHMEQGYYSASASEGVTRKKMIKTSVYNNGNLSK